MQSLSLKTSSSSSPPFQTSICPKSVFFFSLWFFTVIAGCPFIRVAVHKLAPFVKLDVAPVYFTSPLRPTCMTNPHSRFNPCITAHTSHCLSAAYFVPPTFCLLHFATPSRSCLYFCIKSRIVNFRLVQKRQVKALTKHQLTHHKATDMG